MGIDVQSQNIHGNGCSAHIAGRRKLENMPISEGEGLGKLQMCTESVIICAVEDWNDVTVYGMV